MESLEERLLHDREGVARLQTLAPDWFDFEVDPSLREYLITLRCAGVRLFAGQVKRQEEHQVAIGLGPNYPVTPPLLLWRTPIFHPNIMAPSVCLLGRWGMDTRLEEVCISLWDMARYRLLNIEDSLDKAAARWAKEHVAELPLDERDLNGLVTETPGRPSTGRLVGELSEADILNAVKLFAQ